MAYDYIWHTTFPEHSGYQRRARQARAATYSAAWKWIAGLVSAAVRMVTEKHRRLRRARSTYQQLQALDDRQLSDIGLHRAEIASVAEAAAAPRSETGITLADLRPSGVRHSATRAAGVVPLAREHQGRRRPAPWAAKRRAGTAADHERTAA